MYRFILLATLLFSLELCAQDCTSCTDILTYNVDLSASPDATWETPGEVRRRGQCCHGEGSENCVRFYVTTHPNVGRLSFEVIEGATPGPKMYSLNCGPEESIDIPLCVDGPGPHCIIYCKEGNNPERYAIKTESNYSVSPDIAVGNGCSSTIWAKGFLPSSLKWQVVYPDASYNSALSCLAGCEEVTVSTQPDFPADLEYIDVQVSGTVEIACGQNTATETIRVYFINDKTADITPKDATICYGGSSVKITANATGGGPPYNYLWSNGETSQSIDVSSPGDYSVTITDTTDCPSVTSSVFVNQHLSPIRVDAGSALVCTSEPQISLNAEVFEATGGIWTGGNGTFTPDNTALTGIYTLSSDEITNLGTSLTLTSTGNGGCPPSSDIMNIVLSPEPIVDAGTDGKVCQTSLEIPVSGQIIGDTDIGVWKTLGSGTFANQSSLSTTYYPSEADTALGYVNLVLSSIANGACSPVTDTLTIEFGNLPNTNFAFSQPACAGEPVFFNDRTLVSWGNVESYEWQFANLGTSNQRTPSFSFPVAGDYNVTLKTTTDEGCANQITKTVTISDDPTVDFEYEKVCFGSGVAFTNKSAETIAWNWNFGNGFVSTAESPQGIIYGSDGFFDVTLIGTNANGCSDTITKPIEMLPRPVADFQVANICVGDNVNFTDNSSLSVGSIISWKWDFGDGTNSNLQNPTQSFNTSSPLNVKLVVSSALCSDSIVRQVTPLKKPEFLASPTEGCTPLEVNFFNNLQQNVFYNWDFGDGNYSSQPTPTHIFFNPETEPVQYEVTLHARSIFGCSDSVKTSVLVYPQSQSAFSVSTQGVCSGESVQFTNHSVNAVSFKWDFGKGFAAVADENPTQTFTNETDKTIFYPVKLFTTSEYNCEDTVIQYITAHPRPSTDLSISADEACHPANIRFSAQAGAATYSWDFGDGSFEVGSNELDHIFENKSASDRSFEINLEITSLQGCKAEAGTSLTVHPSPVAEFSIDKKMGCSPLNITILDKSENAVSYNWAYGDGQTSATSVLLQQHSFANDEINQKSYEIALAVVSANGCTSNYSESVTIFPAIHASFDLSSNEGCSPFNTDFINTSAGANTYRWEFGDGDFSTNTDARHTFINETALPQQFESFLIASSSFGCVDTSDYKTIAVNPRPIANFGIDRTAGCSPFMVNIDNTTSGATSFKWFMSNGFYSNSNISSHEFSNISNTVEKHTMSLIANNQFNCPDTSIQSVTVFPEPQALFTFSPASGCSPLDVSFSNLSVNAYDFHWDFGDGNESTISQPSNTFTNETIYDQEFNITLTAISDFGCESKLSKTVEVHPVPNADFTVNPAFLKYPQTTALINNNTGGDWIFDWNFGDGTVLSNIKSPGSHNFPGPGTYTLQLRASSSQCWDTISHTLVIRSAEIIADYDSSYTGCAPLEAQFFNKSQNANWYSWDFGDGETSSATNPSHTYAEAGTYVVELTAGNDVDQKISRKHTVTVYKQPTAAFTVAPELAFLPNAQISFFNQSENAEYYKWYFGNGETSTEFETSYAYTETGVYDVALTVESENGCIDSLMIIGAVTVELECDMKFPNAFTPADSEPSGKYNPDMPETTNDIFHPVYKNIAEYNLQIFNRWGELLYESNEVDVGWNGFYKNVICKQDTYVWQVEASCLGGKKISDSGSVTLMR